MESDITRRRLLKGAGALGAGALAAELAGAAAPGWARLVSRAAAMRPAGSDLGAIEHVIFLIMENRSYDCYFGCYPRGRGFDDHPRRSLGNFAQGYPGSTLYPKGKLLPFHLNQQCQNDPIHDWGPMHLCWDHGTMKRFVATHTMSQYEGSQGTTVMGYYDRADLPFYYALADHFTLCDHYFSSVLGPTHPNRLMANSGTIDPDGRSGGPITDTNADPDVSFSCSWPTVQELLEDKGVSWKVYSPSNAGVSGKYAWLSQYPTWNPELYNPTTNPEVMLTSDHVLPYFTAFRNPASGLYQKAFMQTFPGTFVNDIAAGTLPSVSWIIPPQGWDSTRRPPRPGG